MRLVVFIGCLLSLLNAGAKTLYDSPQSDMASFFCAPNSKYVLRYLHCFIDTVYIPQNCEIIFKGGGLSGPIVFKETKLSGKVNLRGSSLSGSIRNKVFEADWLCYMDGDTDDARCINEMISVCDIIHFPKGQYRLISKFNPEGYVEKSLQAQIQTHIGINNSDISLVGEEGATFITDRPICTICIFSQPKEIEQSVRNIVIKSITFDVHNNGQEFHEYMHTIKLIGINGLKIEKCTFNDFWGDAISLSHYGDTPQTGERSRNQNVIIINNTIVGGDHHSNRNGISVINGKNVIIRGNTIRNTSRKDMPGGIDVEPNNSAYTIENIRIENNTLEGINGGGGAICVVAQKGGPAHNIYITENKVSRSNTGIFIYLKTDYTTDNYYIRNNVIDSDTRPYRFEGNGISQHWEVTGNSFMRPCMQPFLGDMTVEGLVMKNNKKKE